MHAVNQYKKRYNYAPNNNIIYGEDYEEES
jgi:hypothetical protein